MDNNDNTYGKLLVLLIFSSMVTIFFISEGYYIYSYIIIILTLAMNSGILYRARYKEKKQVADTEDIGRFSEYFIKDNLFKQIYPLAFIKEDGEMIWCNSRFKEVFESEKISGCNIASIVRGLSLENVLKMSKTYSQKISINRSSYEVYSKKIVDAYENTNIIMVFFNDVTYIEEGTKESIMLIDVDNLTEVSSSIDSIKSSLLVAEIDSVITEYAKSLNAMIKKYEGSKYILSVSDSVIEAEMSKKFDILDRVREISVGNKLEPTLSIGVGRGGVNPRENQKYAVTALELSLGRGGDQVVVKRKDKLCFFGGNTKEIERRTRVRARVIARSLIDLVYESSKVYIVGHKNPDMDCFGAAVGISSVIRQLGKNCKILMGNDTRGIDLYLKKLKEQYKSEELFIDYDSAMNNLDDDTLVIVVDVHARNYVSNIELVDRAKKVVIIDHHRRSADAIEGALLTYIEVYASSTSELITEMVQYMLDKPKLKQIEAEGLLAGICVDTKNFYFKTGVRTFEAASFLRRLGAATIDVKKMFSDDLESYIKRSDTIKSATVENGIAIAICPSSVKDTIIPAQAADELLNITSIKASFVLVKINNDVSISGRSFGDINVQVILESLGGGGHMNIAGTKLFDSTIDEALVRLKKAIGKYLEEGD